MLNTISALGLVNIYDEFRKANPQLAHLVFPKKFDCSSLHVAVTEGQFEMTERLVKDGANVNQSATFFFGDLEISDWTSYSAPLHDAVTSMFMRSLNDLRNPVCQTALLKIIDLLLTNGADPHQQCLNHDTDRYDDTPYKLSELILKEINEGELKKFVDADTFSTALNKVITAGNENQHRTVIIPRR